MKSFSPNQSCLRLGIYLHITEQIKNKQHGITNIQIKLKGMQNILLIDIISQQKDTISIPRSMKISIIYSYIISYMIHS